jgi:hypothetical protein
MEKQPQNLLNSMKFPLPAASDSHGNDTDLVGICNPPSNSTVAGPDFCVTGTFDGSVTRRVTGCSLGTIAASSIVNGATDFTACFRGVPPGTYNLTAVGDDGSTDTHINVTVTGVPIPLPPPVPVPGPVPGPTPSAKVIGAPAAAAAGPGGTGVSVPCVVFMKRPSSPESKRLVRSANFEGKFAVDEHGRTRPVSLARGMPTEFSVGGEVKPGVRVKCTLGNIEPEHIGYHEANWTASFRNVPHGDYVLKVTSDDGGVASVPIQIKSPPSAKAALGPATKKSDSK